MRFSRALSAITLATMTLAWTGCEDDCAQVEALPPAPHIGFIGDSIFDYNREGCQDVGSQLSLMRGMRIENRARGGAHLADEYQGVPSVEHQFHALMDERGEQVEFVVAMGGGNDILHNPVPCLVPFVGCPEIIDDVFDAGYRIADDARARGIDRLLYIGYDVQLPTSPYLGPILNGVMDRLTIEHLAMGVEFRDMRGVYGLIGDTQIDGFHPTPSGSRKIAEAVHHKLGNLGW